MKDILSNEQVRKGHIESDNSDYFSKWGSRNPLITIREEIDNQISAKPSLAGINITQKPGGSTIQTFNDGDTPTPERMEKMKCIGKTVSDRKGASLCGVGQIEGLVAGRKSTKSTATLTFKSVNNGKMSRFVCYANGKDFTINTENSGPFPVEEPNIVEKTYDGMKNLDESEIEVIKTLAAVKIYPYWKENPNFVYTVNNEKISPFSVLYDGVKNESIKRMEIKEFHIHYHGGVQIVKVGAIDRSRYIKPDGTHFEEERADKLDVLYKMSPESDGVFVDVGGTIVITGGKDSWKFIGRNQHSTHNGQRVYIQIPSDGFLKDEIFAESPNKSLVGICLNDITDYDGTHAFKEMLDEINQTLIAWADERDSIDTTGKAVKKEKEKQIFNDIFSNPAFVFKLKSAVKNLTEEERAILGTKKFKTIMANVNNEKEKLCYSSAK